MTLHKTKVLLLENIHKDARKMFTAKNYEVIAGPASLEEADLIREIRDVSILGIRSKTHISRAILDHAEKLLAIGAYCIGTNQIDLTTCTQNAVAVFNAPYSNTRSVVELAIGNMIALIRRSFDASAKLHRGVWDKDSSWRFEMRGKTLGIVGYGNIGSQLSILAELLGMEVYFYDIQDKLALGNTKKCKTLAELLKISNFVSLHVDGRPDNRNLISKRELQIMRRGSYLLNLSRGEIVNLPDLADAVRSRHLAGAAVDVFPVEPKSNSEPFSSVLQNLENVILTPHVGGNTEEAQKDIAHSVTNRLFEYLQNGSVSRSVNFPEVILPAVKKGHRVVHIHKNVPGILARINKIFASHGINIEGQHLQTQGHLGYAVTDVPSADQGLLAALQKIPNTIRTRKLF